MRSEQILDTEHLNLNGIMGVDSIQKVEPKGLEFSLKVY